MTKINCRRENLGLDVRGEGVVRVIGLCGHGEGPKVRMVRVLAYARLGS